MVLALLWLTISMPFVNAAQQQMSKLDKKYQTSMPLGNEEESTNPFGNTTEEKAPGGSSSLSEEYLHDHNHTDRVLTLTTIDHSPRNAGTYIAYHGEMLVPPPNLA